ESRVAVTGNCAVASRRCVALGHADGAGAGMTPSTISPRKGPHHRALRLAPPQHDDGRSSSARYATDDLSAGYVRVLLRARKMWVRARKSTIMRPSTSQLVETLRAKLCPYCCKSGRPSGDA